MKYPKYKYVFALFDFAAIFISFVLSQYFTADILNKKVEMYESEALTYLTFFIFSVVFVFIFQNNNLYKINIFLTRASHITAIIKSFLVGTLILIIFSFLIKFNLLLASRIFVLAFLVTGFMLITMIRLFLLKPVYMNFMNVLKNNTVIIIGAGKTGKLLAEKLLFENFYGITVAGFIDDSVKKGEKIIKDIKVAGNTSELKEIVHNLKADEIIIATDNVSYDELMTLIDRCNELEKNVKLTSELFNIVPEKIVTESYSGIPVVDLSPRVNKTLNYFYKRVFDFAVSLTAIIIFSPVFAIIALMIKLNSPGKIFYNHTRIGKDGKPFTFYKFRSMYLDSGSDIKRIDDMREFIKNEKSSKDSMKVINERRVTAVGKFLRKTSLDELPQLFNVLKGEMSLVGPRPCLPYEYEEFDDWHKRRHTVLPGCTGVWQVSGRSAVSFKDSVILDLYYINNMTPWLDLQLIIKTVPVMILGRGAK